jgi:UDP-3-O-[3-hydroxymyristoyl] N-acetylglucosamine deacetylase
VVDFRQKTLKQEVECTGIGLHTGQKIKLKLRPAPPGTGVRFVRTDLNKHPMVEACMDQVFDTTLATTIGTNGCRVSTIEHLMASFFGLGIDNAVVELDGPEVPVMDGSAAPFVFLIRSAGIKEQNKPKQFMVIKKTLKVKDGDRSITIHPAKEIRIDYTIDFQHPLLRDQQYKLNFSGGDFVREISRARTFGFLKDVEMLQENGLALGGSLDNAVVMDDFRILNEDGLRYKNEFVRHKILDFIGDLSILGMPIIGHFVVKKSGHFLNHQMLKVLLEKKKCWERLTIKTKEEYSRNTIKLPAFGKLEPSHA